MTVFNKVILGGALAASMLAVPALAETAARDLAQEEQNRELVVSFYDSFFNGHDISAADVVAPDYIQHNPMVPNGKDALVGYFSGYFDENPESRAEIVQTSTDGDLVWLHVHSTNGAEDRGQAIVDIFRVEDGMIVEHWDVIQPVPEETANGNTMF